LLKVNFQTETPWFDHFEVRLDRKTWHNRPRNGFLWALHNGKNSVEARPVNKFGRNGIVSRIVVLMQQREV